MTPTRKFPRLAVWLFPVVIVLVVGGFFAAMPWLKSLDKAAALLITAAVAVLVMGYSLYVSTRWQRSLDEVQKASAGFATQWGMAGGSIAFALLPLFPPFQSLMVSLVTRFAAAPGTTVETSVVVFSMTLGFMGVVLLQTIGTLIMSVIWWNARR